MPVAMNSGAFFALFRKAFDDDEKFLASLPPTKRATELARRVAKNEQEKIAWAKREKYLDWCAAHNIYPTRR